MVGLLVAAHEATPWEPTDERAHRRASGIDKRGCGACIPADAREDEPHKRGQCEGTRSSISLKPSLSSSSVCCEHPTAERKAAS